MDRYYHYVFTYDKTKLTLYRDGVFVKSVSCTDLKMPTGAAQYICLGGDSGTNGKATNILNGEVAIARVHGKAATASEVASLYRQITTRKAITGFDNLKLALTSTIPAMAEGTDKTNLLNEGWKLMNNISTTAAEISAFLAKIK